MPPHRAKGVGLGVAGIACATCLALRCRRNQSRPGLGALAGHCVVITGAGHGIGRAVALRLARAVADSDESGLTLALVDINDGLLADAASDILALASHAATGSSRLQVLTYRADVTDEDRVNSLCRQIAADAFPRMPTVTVLAAGIVAGRPFLHDGEEEKCMVLSSADIRKTMETNLLGSIWLARALLPEMLANGNGAVVFLASLMGFMGSARLCDYVASKWALLGFAESLRLELRAKRERSVGVMSVCPYLVNTGMFEGAFEGDAQSKSWVRKLIARLRPAIFPNLHTEDVADGIVSRLSQPPGGALGKLPAQLVLPWHAGWVPALLRLLPYRLQEAIIDLAGGCTGMDSFRGYSPRAA